MLKVSLMFGVVASKDLGDCNSTSREVQAVLLN